MAGFHPHMPATRYSVVAKTLGASMWFWVMYKAKEEGPVVLVRHLFHQLNHLLPSDFTSDARIISRMT
jgi:hypothetical protein